MENVVKLYEYDKTGKEVIACEYDYAFDFQEGLAIVRQDNQWKLIRPNRLSKEEIKNIIQVLTKTFQENAMEVYYDILTGKVIDAIQVKKGIAIINNETRILDWDSQLQNVEDQDNGKHFILYVSKTSSLPK